MRIYLASSYNRREELCGYGAQLQGKGHIVTSRWLSGAHQARDAQLDDDPLLRERFAQENYNDLLAADTCVCFTEPAQTGPARGGRHVEFGIALASLLTTIVVGPVENSYYHLADGQFDNWAQALASGTFEAKEAHL